MWIKDERCCLANVHCYCCYFKCLMQDSRNCTNKLLFILSAKKHCKKNSHSCTCRKRYKINVNFVRKNFYINVLVEICLCLYILMHKHVIQIQIVTSYHQCIYFIFSKYHWIKEASIDMFIKLLNCQFRIFLE